MAKSKNKLINIVLSGILSIVILVALCPISLVTAVPNILGIERLYDGLRIHPCIPANWEKVTAVRPYRGSTLKLTYQNHNQGTTSLVVDGREIEGDTKELTLGKNLTIPGKLLKQFSQAGGKSAVHLMLSY